MRVATGAVVVLACVLRFVHLEADPHYYGWAGHLVDEGRWVEHARSLALHGTLLEHTTNFHLVLAPLFEALSFLAISGFGAQRFAVRLLPALAGCAVLVILALVLRRRATPFAAFVALAPLAVHPDWLVLSRVAVPEMPALALSLASFLVMLGAPATSGRLFAGGLLLAGAIATKATLLPLAGVFAVPLVLQSERRLRDLTLFWGGLALPGGLALVAAAPFWWPRLDGFSEDLTLIAGYAAARPAFEVLTLPLTHPALPVLAPSLLGAWSALLAAVLGATRALAPGHRHLLLGAAIWVVGHLGFLTVVNYAPTRYVVHVLAPLAILTAGGLTTLAARGPSGIADDLASLRPARRILALATLALPAGLLLAPVLTSVVDADVERFRVRSGALFVAWILTTGLATLARRRATGLALLVAAPVAATLLWVGLWTLRNEGIVFWGGDASSGLALLGVSLGVASLAVAVAHQARVRVAPLVVAALGAVGVWGVHLAPGFLAPTYQARDASRELGLRLAGEDLILESASEGMFVDNELHFLRRNEGGSLTSARFTVVTYPWTIPDPDLLTDWEPVETWLLHVAPSYRWRDWEPDRYHCPEDLLFCTRLYRYVGRASP